MSNIQRVYFETGSNQEPFLNLESTGFLGYTGLRHRLSLPENDGVLFDFGRDDFHRFWMESVNFPIDIIFLDKNNVVVDIVYGSPLSKEDFTSVVPACTVVEANAGWSKNNNVVTGVSARFQGVGV